MGRKSRRARAGWLVAIAAAGVLVAATVALANRGRTPDPANTDDTDDTDPSSLTVEQQYADPVGGTAPPITGGGKYATRSFGNGLTSADLGCVDDLSAASIDGLLRERMGPSLSLDNAHLYELSDKRYLWIFHDAFLDYSGTSDNLIDTTYLSNVALLQDDKCFQMLHHGSLDHPTPFELGRDLRSGQYMWPLGGTVGSDGRLYVFWTQMQEDRQPRRLDGIKRHPIRTWLAAYEGSDFRRVLFQPAPNAGVKPQYGSVVETDGEYSYLFGNSNLLNLALEGGFGADDHSGTREYLARVPAGHLTEQPEYFAGDGWSSHPGDAVPISERFTVANAMQPRLIDNRWYSVVKRNEFWGVNLVIDVADNPWGPWRTVYNDKLAPIPPEGMEKAQVDDLGIVTYQPIILPWKDPSGGLIIVISQNGTFNKTIYAPAAYRPRAIRIDVGR